MKVKELKDFLCGFDELDEIMVMAEATSDTPYMWRHEVDKRIRYLVVESNLNYEVRLEGIYNKIIWIKVML